MCYIKYVIITYFSPQHLKTGTELVMSTNYPTQGPLLSNKLNNLDDSEHNLCILKKLKLRLDKDVSNLYTRKLKYRGVRVIPPIQVNGFYFFIITP